MAKISEHHFPEAGDYQTFVDLGPDQEQADEQQEVSNLASFVAICLFIGMIALVADAICHMSELPV